eukprot:CAMPEP_0194080556 /NCGR_PEP_ID=MMETSP0149-20130528/6556_1 /TAXON_ID=122233 /ORGANISM="Chaetoceros debilis, Strain MM31A-1" /LENGTH=833 /DNA_ID=CAMNT_0038762305 /DNA_START=114 /DNA_END=2615 /DNA_ORIENTATION=+
MKIMFPKALLSLILLPLADAEVSKPPPFMNSFVTPEPTVSPAPTVLPTFRPSVSSIPSNQPSSSPSMSPTSNPSLSSMPTITKSNKPSITLSRVPSTNPTLAPSKPPTSSPTLSPSMNHSVAPSPLPSSALSSDPTGSPTLSPSSKPTAKASAAPSHSPEGSPSSIPTSNPTMDPSFSPTESPSVEPTSNPAASPSSSPEGSPSAAPTETSQPSVLPSLSHSKSPSTGPSLQPSEIPSGSPEGSPSSQPSSQPSNHPSSLPSSKPSNQPSSQPTVQPSTFPSTRPTSVPTTPKPSVNPSSVPTSTPSTKPSSSPTSSPSISPSRLPSGNPTSTPTMNPSEFPSDLPSMEPSNQPTSLPTSLPSENPTEVHVVVYNTTMVIGFQNFNVAMDDSHEDGFENYVKNFITMYMEKADRVDVQIDSVKVVSQYRQLDVQDGLQNRSRLLKGNENENDSMDISRELVKVGLLVEVQVLATLTYGAALPADFSVSDVFSLAIDDNFKTFMDQIHKNSANGAWGPPLFEETEPPEQKSNYLLIISLAVGCSVGGMILGSAILLLFSRRRGSSTVIREFQHQSNPTNPYGDLVGASPRIMLQESDDFLNTNQSSSIFTNPNTMDEEFGKSRSSTWDWRNSESRPSGSNGRDNDHGEDEESDHSSAYELEGQRELANMYSSASSTNIDTPSESASTCTGQGSLGINLSPEALYEAQKQQQQFTFVPRETNASLGMVYPESALAHGNSNRDQNRTGKLVYKSLVCYAPPGPLGVIIDTTAEGPMVHSIKPTSQLLGSMAPGDVVVGLDNIETRQMTAPALTRLMARKSQQPKRKITLLRPVMTH